MSELAEREREMTITLCANCKQARARARGLCASCYIYRLRHGRSRPRHYFIETCKVCERPRDTAATSFRNGRCDTCYQYRRRYGKDRPQYLLERQARKGWCDCGEPAVANKAVTVGHSMAQTLRLCEECLEWERQSA